MNEQLPPGECVYDGFLSYRCRTDYARARWIETFLEGVHRLKERTGAPLRPLRICRDGSDFRLPAKRDSVQAGDRVWQIIRTELERSRYLLVLCSPGAPDSSWMEAEISWFLEKAPENILLILTEAADPIGRQEECFPPAVLRHGLHASKIWYDLRAHDRSGRKPGVRDWEDECVRLAADLLDWNADANGPLWSIYEREQLRARRTQAGWVTAIAVVVLIVAAAAGWYALQSNRQAKRARANAIVAAAQASPDPLAAALMLTELEDEPEGGISVARSVASQNLAPAELRGPQSAIAHVQFLTGTGQVAAASADGSLFVWNQDGRGERMQSNATAGGRPVGMAISQDGRLIATATREHRGMMWSPRDRRTWSYEIPGMIESIQTVAGQPGPLAITEDGKVFVFEPDRPARELMISGPSIAALHAAGDGGLLIAARNGDLWTRPAGARELLKLAGPPAAVLSEFPFNGPAYARFSPDGEWYVVAFQDRLLLRSVRRPMQFFRLEYGDLMNSLAFDSTSKRLAAAGSRGVIVVWEAATGKKLREFDSRVRIWSVEAGIPTGPEPDSFSVKQVGFAPGNPNVLAAITSDSVVRLWNTGGGSPSEYRGHIGADTIAWAADGHHLATGADVGTVRIWSVDQEGDPIVLRHASSVHDALFFADNRVVSLTRDGIVREFSSDTFTVRKLARVGSPPTALAAGSDRTRVFVGYEDGTLRIAEGQPLLWTQQFRPLKERISRIIVRGSRVFSASKREVAVIDIQSTSATRTFDSHGRDIVHVDVSTDGDEFVIAHEDGTVVRQPMTASSRTLHAADGKTVFDARYSPDGKSLLTCSQNGTAVLYGLGSNSTSKPLDIPSGGEWLETCAFSPDGRHILITGSSGRAWVCGAAGESPQLLRRANGLAHIGSILSIAFSADSSRVLLTGGVDGKATVWNVESAKLLTVLSGHTGTVTAGAISPDGTRLLTASEDGSVRVWSDGWKTLLQHLRLRSTATLNPEQRATALGESEPEAWDTFWRREAQYGRRRDSYGPFKYPF